MLRRKGIQLGLRGALVGSGPRWWALTVLMPLLCGSVPIFLVNSVLRDVKGDVATWQSQIAQLTDKVRIVVSPVALLLRHCSRGFCCTRSSSHHAHRHAGALGSLHASSVFRSGLLTLGAPKGGEPGVRHPCSIHHITCGAKATEAV